MGQSRTLPQGRGAGGRGGGGAARHASRRPADHAALRAGADHGEHGELRPAARDLEQPGQRHHLLHRLLRRDGRRPSRTCRALPRPHPLRPCPRHPRHARRLRRDLSGRRAERPRRDLPEAARGRLRRLCAERPCPAARDRRQRCAGGLLHAGPHLRDRLSARPRPGDRTDRSARDSDLQWRRRRPTTTW